MLKATFTIHSFMAFYPKFVAVCELCVLNVNGETAAAIHGPSCHLENVRREAFSNLSCQLVYKDSSDLDFGYSYEGYLHRMLSSAIAL